MIITKGGSIYLQNKNKLMKLDSKGYSRLLGINGKKQYTKFVDEDDKNRIKKEKLQNLLKSLKF